MLNATPILQSKVMQVVPTASSTSSDTPSSQTPSPINPNVPSQLLIEPWYTKKSYILIAASMVSMLILGTAIALKR